MSVWKFCYFRGEFVVILVVLGVSLVLGSPIGRILVGIGVWWFAFVLLWVWFVALICFLVFSVVCVWVVSGFVLVFWFGLAWCCAAGWVCWWLGFWRVFYDGFVIWWGAVLFLFSTLLGLRFGVVFSGLFCCFCGFALCVWLFVIRRKFAWIWCLCVFVLIRDLFCGFGLVDLCCFTGCCLVFVVWVWYKVGILWNLMFWVLDWRFLCWSFEFWCFELVWLVCVGLVVLVDFGFIALMWFCVWWFTRMIWFRIDKFG